MYISKEWLFIIIQIVFLIPYIMNTFRESEKEEKDRQKMLIIYVIGIFIAL